MFSLLLTTIGKKVSDKDATTPFFVKDVSGAANTLSIVKNGDGAPTISIEKSADGVNWETLGSTSTTALTVTIPAGGRVYLRSASAVTTWGTSNEVYNHITANKNHHIGGNILSLLMGEDFAGAERFGSNTADYAFYGLFSGDTKLINASKVFMPDNVKAHCYRSMFYGCTSLVATPTLPATTLADNCYHGMFYGCTSLVNAPSLPATTLAPNCYNYMFKSTALTTAPTLPATTLATSCYKHMFTGCASLTVAPALPADTLVSECYRFMFQDCTALTTAPTLSATTLATNCYSNMFEGCTALTTAPTISVTTMASYACQYMFNGCTSLVTAPTLSATTLATYCYSNMFNGCTSLVTAPAISATTLANNACQSMFRDCTALTTAPTLSATTLAASCYEDMFYGCTSLATAPVLPATTMAAGCYAGMFRGCTSLTAAPELPATTLADSCYMLMFESCTSLTEAPELPAETLATNCYSNMFEGCTSLVYAPDLPATTLVAGCYTNMFYGCSLLSYIKAMFTTTPSTTYTENWVYGVAATGIFVKSTKASWNVTGDNGIPVGWTVYLEGRSYDIPFYVENRRKTNGEVLIGNFGAGGEPNLLIEISPDGVTWTTAGYTGNHLRIDIAGKHRLYIRCATDSWSHKNSIYLAWNRISVAGGISINVGGNIMSLLKGSSFNSDTEFGATVEDGAFYKLFIDTPVVDASLLMLPTNTKPECYRSMFNDNVGLEAAPVLPAETLTEGCYMEMFKGCWDLTTAPELPAETLVTGCYEEMFYNCTSLNYIKALFTTTPSTDYTENWVYGVAETGTFEKSDSATWNVVGVNGVPTGWVVPGSYNIPFYVQDISGAANTLSIVKYSSPAPTISIEKSADGVNWETLGSTSTTALTVTIPAGGRVYLRSASAVYAWANYSGYHLITATGNHNIGGNILSLLDGHNYKGVKLFGGGNFGLIAFWNLFSGDRTLVDASKLKLPEDVKESCFSQMFIGCTSLVNAPDLPATTLASYCYNNMFNGCTALTTAPTLPATTLASYCYNKMFYYCTSLVTAPTLPATTLTDKCYNQMFYGCTLLNYIKALFTTTPSSYYTENWVFGVAETGTFEKSDSATWNVVGVNGVPMGWTVQTATE